MNCSQQQHTSPPITTGGGYGGQVTGGYGGQTGGQTGGNNCGSCQRPCNLTYRPSGYGCNKCGSQHGPSQSFCCTSCNYDICMNCGQQHTSPPITGGYGGQTGGYGGQTGGQTGGYGGQTGGQTGCGPRMINVTLKYGHCENVCLTQLGCFNHHPQSWNQDVYLRQTDNCVLYFHTMPQNPTSGYWRTTGTKAGSPQIPLQQLLACTNPSSPTFGHGLDYVGVGINPSQKFASFPTSHDNYDVQFIF